MSDRYWILYFNDATHRADLNSASELTCIVDEEAGGIIAYAVSEEAAAKIVNALISAQ